MDRRDILERIIDEDGSCDWAFKHDPSDEYYICSRCPMSRLRKKPNGEWMSCYEALTGMPHHVGSTRDRKGAFVEPNVDKIYIDKAKELLSDDLMEDLIKEGR